VVASKVHGLLWLEQLKESQRLTQREERRKDEVVGIFENLYRISNIRLEAPDFPPWKPSW
jgi:hypothetical protein